MAFKTSSTASRFARVPVRALKYASLNAAQVSKIPVICICNDRWSQKLRSLQNHCLELQFHRPTKQQIRSRMLQIAQQEGLKVNEIAMEALIESCNSDIRLVLNTLQVRAASVVCINRCLSIVWRRRCAG